MSELPESLAGVDWSLTTWEGSRREQLRRWAALPLDRLIAAIEEMEELQRALGPPESAPMTREEILDMRGTGWDGDLDEMRGGERPELL